MEKIHLGSTGIEISPMGIGAWSWGDRFFWGYGLDYHQEDAQAAAEVSLSAGINFFDTAEMYGMGHSERLVGKFLGKFEPRAVIATKVFPYPWRLTKGQVELALRASLKRLDMDRVDLYQVHWPYSLAPVETWANGLAEVVEKGLSRAVGVSNYNQQQMRRANAVLVKRGILLASNQVEYSLVQRKVEKNGLLQLCRDLGITLIAYSPLTQGLLTGKYTTENPPKGVRGRRYSASMINRMQPLIRLMREIGKDHGGKTPAQIAINWVVCKGAVPIPGAKNAQQAVENAGALGWSLSDDEVLRLDRSSDQSIEGA